MSAVILGLGTALPGNSLPTEEVIAHAKRFACKSPKQERVLEELYRRTAIQQRNSVLSGRGSGSEGYSVFQVPSNENEHGPTTSHRMGFYAAEIGPMAKRACEVALANSGLANKEITHIVTASCTGFNAPGFDVELIHSLPLGRGTMRTHVGFMGCHGGMNALRTAHAYANADPSAAILVCAAEACTIHFQYGWGTDKLVANSLFADGAAAFVVMSSDGLRDHRCRQDAGAPRSASPPTNSIRRANPPLPGSAGFQPAPLPGAAGILPAIQLINSASYVVPDSLDVMRWRIGDHGFEMHLSTSVPQLIEELLPDWIDEWLSKCDFSRNEITGWAVHPGGPKILDAVESALKLNEKHMAASRHVLATCGNMSSPTVFFILNELMTQGQSGPCVILGFGPGLTIEAALVHLP